MIGKSLNQHSPFNTGKNNDCAIRFISFISSSNPTFPFWLTYTIHSLKGALPGHYPQRRLADRASDKLGDGWLPKKARAMLTLWSFVAYGRTSGPASEEIPPEV